MATHTLKHWILPLAPRSNYCFKVDLLEVQPFCSFWRRTEKPAGLLHNQHFCPSCQKCSWCHRHKLPSTKWQHSLSCVFQIFKHRFLTLLPSMIKVFMTSQTQAAKHKMAVLSESCFQDFQTWIFNTLSKKRTEALQQVYFLFHFYC